MQAAGGRPTNKAGYLVTKVAYGWGSRSGESPFSHFGWSVDARSALSMIRKKCNGTTNGKIDQQTEEWLIKSRRSKSTSNKRCKRRSNVTKHRVDVAELDVDVV